MAPGLKILMSFASRKGTQIYYPFLSNVPAVESPPGSQMGPLWREMPISRAFLNISSRVCSKGVLPRGPPHWASSERNTPFLEPPSSISQSPQYMSPIQGSPAGPLWKEMPIFRTFPTCLPGYPPGFLHRSPIERETLHLQSPFSAISQSPQQMRPLQFAELSLHEDRWPSPEPSVNNTGSPLSRAPYQPSLKVPIWWTPPLSRFPILIFTTA